MYMTNMAKCNDMAHFKNIIMARESADMASNGERSHRAPTSTTSASTFRRRHRRPHRHRQATASGDAALKMKRMTTNTWETSARMRCFVNSKSGAHDDRVSIADDGRVSITDIV